MAGVSLLTALTCASLAMGRGGFTPFTEEAASRGIDYTPQIYVDGLGSAFADLDNDGDADLITLGRPGDLIGLYENDGTGHFIDRQPGSGMGQAELASGVVAGDYDLDGDLDVFITRFAGPNHLFRNDGDFQFTDVTVAAGVGDTGPGTGCAWGDFDHDGWPDLYVSNYGVPNLLYHNQGDGTFIDVAETLGVHDTNEDSTFQAVFFDYDHDGDADLYVANDRGGSCEPDHWHNHLFENTGGAFEDVTWESGTEGCLDSMCAAIGDFDANGHQDIYVTNTPPGNLLLMNNGDRTFSDETASAAVGSFAFGWGARFLDFDNDGRLDLYVCNMNAPNRLYRHDGSWPCVDVAPQLGVDLGVMSFTVAAADIDNDGDLDMLVQNRQAPMMLLINHEGQTRSWARFDVIGEGPARYAIGAQVTVTAGGAEQLREVIAGSDYKSQSELVLHYGLGDAAVLESVHIRWPGGTTRVVNNLAANERWVLYPPDKLADGDRDGDIDLSDFVMFHGCFTGDAPGSLPPGCEAMDLDGDADVDHADFTLFLVDYSGPLDDCNGNGTLDLQEILDGAADLNSNGVLDECEEPCSDLNGDAVVDDADLLQLTGDWGQSTSPADLDGDGIVSTSDLLILLADWGPCD